MQFNKKLKIIFWNSLVSWNALKCCIYATHCVLEQSISVHHISFWNTVTSATAEFFTHFPHLYFLSLCALALAALPFTDRHGLRNKRPAAACCQKCIKALHRPRFHISPAIRAPWNWTFSSVQRVSDSSRAESKQPPARGSYHVARINRHHSLKLPAALLDSLPTPQEQETRKPTTVTVQEILLMHCRSSSPSTYSLNQE